MPEASAADPLLRVNCCTLFEERRGLAAGD
jgi:hypothetical protein